jgi:hypothetical protein
MNLGPRLCDPAQNKAYGPPDLVEGAKKVQKNKFKQKCGTD